MATGKNAKEVVALLDKFTEIDPMGAIVVTSAGIAGACGIRGPLTTIMTGLVGSVGSSSGSVSTNPLLLLTPLGTPEAVFEGLNWLTSTLNGKDNQPVNASDDEKKAVLQAIGGAAGNIVEAGIMYTLVRNPETLRQLFDITKEGVKGVAGLAKLGGVAGVL